MPLSWPSHSQPQTLQLDARPARQGVAGAVITRSWIVAVQALVVGVLVVVVAVTLLKPEDSEDLAGVEAPGASSAPELPGPGGYANRSNDGRRSGGTTAAPSTGIVPGGTPGTDDGSPSDDQYSDTLSDLDARLR